MRQGCRTRRAHSHGDKRLSTRPADVFHSPGVTSVHSGASALEASHRAGAPSGTPWEKLEASAVQITFKRPESQQQNYEADQLGLLTPCRVQETVVHVSGDTRVHDGRNHWNEGSSE